VSCLTRGQTSFRDGSACTRCDIATRANLDPKVQDCVCNNGDKTYYLVEYAANGLPLAAKQCRRCPGSNSRVYSDPYKCEPCPDPTMVLDFNQDCACPSASQTIIGNKCIDRRKSDSVAPLSLASVVYFRDIEATEGAGVTSKELKSVVFNKYYLPAAVLCKESPSSYHTFCQTLGNLCALQKYERTTAVCEAYLSTYASSARNIVNQFPDWHLHLPWLYYTNLVVLDNTALTSSFRLTSEEDTSDFSITSQLRIKLASYALNGTFLGLDDLHGQLQLCDSVHSNKNKWHRFATSYTSTCTMDLLGLVAKPLVFYDMYIVDAGNKLYPVPVKILNYRVRNKLVNKDADGAELDTAAVFRRFFLVDSESGKRVEGKQPEILVFARKVTLRISVRSDTDDKIYPPLLIIDYAEREVSKLSNGGEDGQSTVTFHVEYVKDLEGVYSGAIAFWGVTIGFILMAWGIRMYAWSKSNGAQAVDFTFAMRAVVFLFGTTANFFLWWLALVTGYFFVFFKGQVQGYLLLPSKESFALSTLTSMVTVALIGKLVEVLYFIWWQTNVDVFFVDWEPSRESVEKKSSVSVWRKIFVVNEWNELQMTRGISIELTLFLVIFLLEGMGLKNLATAQPNTADLSSNAGPIDPLLRFFVSSLVWIVVALLQFAYYSMVFDRFYDTEIESFVDLCATANVSAFIFDQRFHCYYIHGKTIHNKSDVTLEELNEQIVREEKGLTGPRGLRGKDRQAGNKKEGHFDDAFEVYLDPDLRYRFDKVFGDLVHRKGVVTTNAERGNFGRERGDNAVDRRKPAISSSVVVSNKLIEAHYAMEDFLKNFVNKQPGAPSWNFGELKFFHRRFGIPPVQAKGPRDNKELDEDLDAKSGKKSKKGTKTKLSRFKGTSYFFDDGLYRFTKVLMKGLDVDIVFLLILLFSMCELLFDSPSAAILVCYSADRLLLMLRARWGLVNVAKKTMVPARYLV